VAASYLGLPAHLILRNSSARAQRDPGLVGNLLVERLVGASVHQARARARVCVCVCARARVRVCARARARVRVCVCV
jgi:hypothetical protein